VVDTEAQGNGRENSKTSLAVRQGNGSHFDYAFGGNIDQALAFAETLSKSSLVPKEFQDNPASTLIALDFAARCRRNPLEIMQAMYIVHGKPSFSSSFLISLINSSGYYEPLRFEFNDKRTACRAWTIDKRTGEKVRGTTITMEMARQEGWVQKNGSKWQTMPEVMLQYRAASFFYRANCPDLLGAFQSVEEVVDVEGGETRGARLSATVVNTEPESKSKTEQLAEKIPGTQSKSVRDNPDFNEEGMELTPLTNGNGNMSEVEKLRDELKSGLFINYTKAEAEAWCLSNFGNEVKDLKKEQLRAAIVKINAELDAREL